MAEFKSFTLWLESRRPYYFEVLRIYLGIGLFVLGIQFVSQTDLLMGLMLEGGTMEFTSTALAHYIALAHLCGGLFMAVGMLTRAAALAQIPVLIGAVFVVHWQQGLMLGSHDLRFSALVLVLLILVFLHGSGEWSLDHYLFRKKKES